MPNPPRKKLVVDTGGYAWWTPQRSEAGQPGVELTMQVKVVILGARHVFGRKDYLIKPADGAGRRWVAENRLSFSERA